MKKNFLKLFLTAAVVAVLSAGSAQAGVIIIRTSPPKVKIEVRPRAPFTKAIWVPGRWTWKRGHYVWVKGHYVKARKGFVWAPGHWAKRRHGWVWIGGHWKRI